MCTAGAPRPPHTAGPRAGGRAQSEPAVDAPGPARVPVRTSSARARRGHGRAPRGPLSAGARAVLRLGRAGRRLPEAGRRVPEPLPVLPHHRALHASAAGGRARRGAADLHPVSAAGRGARGAGAAGAGVGAYGRRLLPRAFVRLGRGAGGGRAPCARPPEPPLFGAQNQRRAGTSSGAAGKPRSPPAPRPAAPARPPSPCGPVSLSSPSPGHPSSSPRAPVVLLPVSPPPGAP